jgi:hypothetical protein
MFVVMLVVTTDAKSAGADQLSLMVVAVAAAAVLIALAAPATAADPGKRFAHNRGTWASGLQPIDVHGSVDHPRSLSIRVEWRDQTPPPPKPKPPPAPEPEPEAFAAAAIPDGGITVAWGVNCPTPSRAHWARGKLHITSSPDTRSLRLPRRRGPFCLVSAQATGPSGDSIGKILLDLYART